MGSMRRRVGNVSFRELEAIGMGFRWGGVLRRRLIDSSGWDFLDIGWSVGWW